MEIIIKRPMNTMSIVRTPWWRNVSAVGEVRNFNSSDLYVQ